MRLADRSDACEGPGWSRTEHMQQESGYVGGVPKMAAGAEAFLEDAGCWQASLQNARELLEAAGARERARVGGSDRRADCPRAWLAPGSPEEGTTPRPAKEGDGRWRWRAGWTRWFWLLVQLQDVLARNSSAIHIRFTFGCAVRTHKAQSDHKTYWLESWNTF